MADNLLSFKISSGLKNIIGRDLITDDYVAVFELVKNSFDAYAKKVTITFSENKIKINDDGKGMNIDDINNKWLFVAYSAKKEGVEDKDFIDKKFETYRDKIQSKKYYAGAKGIGRFSCDRLGSKLLLTTKEAKPDSKIEQIEVNWEDFDKDPEEGFLDVKVKHRTIVSPNEYKKFIHGTRLEITNLNSTWDREKKIGLKHSLEKLINPFEDNSQEKFSIFIIDESEEEADRSVKRSRDKVNGNVQNFVFELLELKTTQILSEIDSNGDYITITLRDRGVLIYKIRKKNRITPKLHNITFNLFFLNKAAKSNFNKLMGIDSVNFGSVFLYKNGFRIAPYGDVGFDYFGLDSRKAQKHFDRLGSRDLIGRVEIIGENSYFKEISSRDGGLVRNDHYLALVQCFISQCLKKLEDYLNEVQWTNKDDKNREDLSALSNIKAKSALLKLINDEIEDDDSELLDADKENINLRTQELIKESSEKDIKFLRNIAKKLKDSDFVLEAKDIEKERLRIIELQNQLEIEEERRQKIESDLKEAERLLELEKEKNTYLRTSSRSIGEDAKGLVHNIKITTRIINSNIDALFDKIKSGKVNNEDLLKRLGVIKFNADKALKISKLITRSNFKAQQNEQIIDVVKYINQYLEIYSDIYEKSILDFEIIDNGSSLIKKISVLDISIIIDDLISNAEKANANRVKIEISNIDKTTLKILFSDNGSGVSKKFIENPEDMFDLGVTTTDGSGIGLFSIKTALKAMNGQIRFIGNNILLKGATFEIILT